jgi:hypothetical protein
MIKKQKRPKKRFSGTLVCYTQVPISLDPTLTSILSLRGGRGGMAPKVIFEIRKLFHLNSGIVLKNLALA